MGKNLYLSTQHLILGIARAWEGVIVVLSRFGLCWVLTTHNDLSGRVRSSEPTHSRKRRQTCGDDHPETRLLTSQVCISNCKHLASRFFWYFLKIIFHPCISSEQELFENSSDNLVQWPQIRGKWREGISLVKIFKHVWNRYSNVVSIAQETPPVCNEAFVVNLDDDWQWPISVEPISFSDYIYVSWIQG